MREHGVERVIVAGMQSEYCVQATSRGAGRAGFRVLLAQGSHATYDNASTAAQLSAAVERELEAEDVQVLSLSEIEFR